MGDPFTPPNSSSRTGLSWLLPQPPAKSSLLCDLLDLELLLEEGGTADLLSRDNSETKLNADATFNEQANTMAISTEGLAFVMVCCLWLLLFVVGPTCRLRRGTWHCGK